MSYDIAQEQTYVGNDYWKWSVWIVASDDELDQIRSVTWILHASFKKPRVLSTDRANNFRLHTAGWGTFRLRAELKLKNSEIVKLKHDLTLEYPPDAPNPKRGMGSLAPSSLPSVFLSYSSADARLAASVKERLTAHGAIVLDASEVEPGKDLNAAIESMMHQAQTVIGVVGADEASPWVVSELKRAQANQKPAFALVMQGNESAGLPKGVEQFSMMESGFDASAVLGKITQF